MYDDKWPPTHCHCDCDILTHSNQVDSDTLISQSVCKFTMGKASLNLEEAVKEHEKNPEIPTIVLAKKMINVLFVIICPLSSNSQLNSV